MSWSVTFIGNPENIAKALKEHSNKIDGQSKEEYDAALPHLTGLIEQNYNRLYPPVLRITASGSGYGSQDQNYSYCAVNIENIGGQLV